VIGAHQLTIVADLTYRQVDHWTRAGYLRTVDDPMPGSGNHRAYDDDQIAIAVQLSRLTKAGIPMPQALPIALDLLEHGRADLGGYVLSPVTTTDLAGQPLHDVVRTINKSGDNAA
jgi:DNA-binding transcriptional MerR regulator